MSNALATAIYSRSQIAGDFKTSIGGRFYLFKTPGVAVYPYVTYSILTDSPDYYLDSKTTSSHNFEYVDISMNIHSNLGSSSEAGTILEYLKTHFDDYEISITGWTTKQFERSKVLGPFWNDEIQEWIYSVTYNIILQKD